MWVIQSCLAVSVQAQSSLLSIYSHSDSPSSATGTPLVQLILCVKVSLQLLV